MEEFDAAFTVPECRRDVCQIAAQVVCHSAVLCCAHAFDLCRGHRDKFLLLGFDEDEAKRLFKAHYAIRLIDGLVRFYWHSAFSYKAPTAPCKTMAFMGEQVLDADGEGELSVSEFTRGWGLNACCQLFPEHARILP